MKIFLDIIKVKNSIHHIDKFQYIKMIHEYINKLTALRRSF